MNCFNHSEVQAVGVCKSCGRALCRDCIVEVGLACSCKNRCEAIVAMMNDLMERGSSAYQKTGATYFRNGVFVSLLGVAFLGYGALGLVRGDSSVFPFFIMVCGLLFLSMGVSSFVTSRRFKQK